MKKGALKLDDLPVEEYKYNNRILVVDDEPEIINSYKSILNPPAQNIVSITRSSRSKSKAPSGAGAKREHFEVVSASNAQEALDLVRKAAAANQPFAMGFFDVLLGEGLDGIELVREIRKIDPSMYAVFVTAYNDRSVDSINKVLGTHEFWDYLNKPFGEGEILQKARNATAFWNLSKEKEFQDNKLSEVNSKLSEKERLMSVATVARGVGHEFGNILVQIMGRAELSRDGNEEEMRKALDTIMTAGETATNILDRFKNLAKPSSHDSKPQQFDIHQPIDTALTLTDHQLQTANITVNKNIPDSILINGNETAITQVFVNLLINALHAYDGKEGSIDINGTIEGSNLKLIFRDHGPGIPDEILEQVFERFFTTKEDKGTGLGLAICKDIIELEHSGEMTVKNSPDGGAEFTITLPMDQGDSNE